MAFVDQMAGRKIRALRIVDDDGVAGECLKIAVEQDERDRQREKRDEIVRHHLGPKQKNARAVGVLDLIEVLLREFRFIEILNLQAISCLRAGGGDPLGDLGKERRVIDDGAVLFIYNKMNAPVLHMLCLNFTEVIAVFFSRDLYGLARLRADAGPVVQCHRDGGRA